MSRGTEVQLARNSKAPGTLQLVRSEAASAALSSSASCARFRGGDSLCVPMRRRFAATAWMAPTFKDLAFACKQGVQVEEDCICSLVTAAGRDPAVVLLAA